MLHFLSVFSWITLAFWAVLIAYLVRGARTADASIARPQRGSVFLRLFKAAAMLYVLALLYVPAAVGVPVHPVLSGAVRGLAGVVLCAAGVVLVIAARVALGRNWSDLVVLKTDHELIQSGPYRWIRHPLYSGVLLAVLGSALTVHTRIAYVTVPVLLAGFAIKSHREENLLERNFPAYRQYRARVKGFIPLVF
jgi:protein-S-isoprenylcysteine O-methyltransferase Ste14